MLWYMQGVSVGSDLTCHRYILRGLVSQKIGGFCEIDVCGVQIDFAKVQWVLRERDVDRVPVYFTQIRGFHKIVINRVCVDFVKVQGAFYKIDIYKVRMLFCQIVVYGLRVDFTKAQRGLQNLRPQLFLAVGSADRRPR